MARRFRFALANRNVVKANRLANSGNYDEALVLLANYRSQLPSFGLPAAEADYALAVTFYREAEIEFRRGNVQDGMVAYGRCETELRRDDANREYLGRIIHDFAISASEYLPRSASITLLAEARQILAEFGQHYVSECDKAIADLESLRLVEGDADLPGGRRGEVEVDDRVNALRKRVDGMRHDLDWAMEQANLAQLLLNFSPGDNVEAQQRMSAALTFFRTQRRWTEYVSTLSMIKLAATNEFEIIPPIVNEIEFAKSMAESTRDPVDRVKLLESLATAAFVAGDSEWDIALDFGLRAIALAEQRASETKSTVVRAITRSDGEISRYITLTIAMSTGRHGLAAELIEGSRLQVVPLTTVAGNGRSDVVQSVTNVATKVGNVALSPIHLLATDQASYLRSYHSPTCVADSDISLKEMITEVGGLDAWWWGAMLIDYRYFWATMSPDGEWSAGWTDLAQDFVQSLNDARAAVLSPGRDEALIFRAYSVSYRHEEEISLRLGTWLIPPPLRLALFDDSSRDGDHAPSVVIASNFLASLPTCLLAVQTSGGVVRFLERAVLRWAPPAAVVAIARSNPLYYEPSHPVAVACIDPDGSLANARRVRVRAAVQLRNSQSAKDSGETALPATRSNLLSALQRHGASTPGTFFYSGHSGRGVVGLDGGLVLEDGLLSASEIMFGTGDLSALVLPSRVVLSSCDSSGAGGEGRGEWLGIGAACLLRGARQIVATGWPILDLPITVGLEEEILDALQYQTDLATIVRNAQLSRLAAWRSSDHEFKFPKFDPQARIELPLVWSAFQPIGLRL
jgi:hypothetical protein